MPKHIPFTEYPTERDPQTGCLRWRGPLHSGGYGRHGDCFYAHRTAYTLAYGAIPPGFQVDHVAARGCRWRDCVEPTHLEAVPQAVNIARQANVIAQVARTHCPHGHAYAGDNLVVRRGKRECRTCIRTRNNLAKKARTARAALLDCSGKFNPRKHP